MKVLVLTSNELRHRYFVGKLLDQGFEVQAWAEAKGKPFNEDRFQDQIEKDILQMHKNLLSWTFESAINEFSEVSVMELFSRGTFSRDTIIPRILEFNPDLVLVYGCGIVGSAILDLFPRRILGSHQGLPQYYRGSGSNYFAFLNGESARMGMSVHIIDKGIDTGSILYQYAPEPEISDTYYTYSAKLIKVLPEVIIEIIKQLENNVEKKFTGQILKTKGKLYQRKDFTPDSLQKMIYRQLEGSFYSLYQKSIVEYGKPELISNPIVTFDQ